MARRGATSIGDDDRDAPARPFEGRPRDAAPERSAAGREPRPRFAITASGAKRPAPKGDRKPAASVLEPQKRKRKREVPADVASEIRQFASPREVARIELRLADAARAYERERYGDALTTLRELAKTTPGASSVRELLGLTYYRLGRWKEALRELRAFTELTASVDQNPVLADCERALGRHDRVEELWAELRRAGAGSDVLAEGRLVMAGSLADRGRISEAIELLLPAANREVRKPLDRHLRQWYALGDLFERSGDLPRAREYFTKVVNADVELTNAAERLAALR